MSRIITVFGATGAQGGGLARTILSDPRRRFRLRAVTRKPESPAAVALKALGAEVVVADIDDATSVRRAMEGAHGAFCVTNFWEHFSADKEVAQAHAMAQAAIDAGVRHVIWSTLEDTREIVPVGSGRMPVLMGRYNVPHYDGKGEANAAFIDRGVPTTLLYTSFFWDNLVHFGMQPQRGTDGVLGFVLPMGEAQLPGIAAADVGPCAFGIFARGDELVGKSIGIAGEHLSGAQMAQQLALALGEPVRHVALTPSQYAALGFPGAEDLANMFRFKREFERMYCDSRSVGCTRELHPGAQSFAQWLAANARRIPIAERAAA
ncbi:MAG TPA: NmrA/HSCARG family protein [Burkholderiaceae bacterium]|nr:NmrA/HSCARG family protein [Burkholderiaceae bacterium]